MDVQIPAHELATDFKTVESSTVPVKIATEGHDDKSHTAQTIPEVVITSPTLTATTSLPPYSQHGSTPSDQPEVVKEFSPYPEIVKPIPTTIPPESSAPEVHRVPPLDPASQAPEVYDPAAHLPEVYNPTSSAKVKPSNTQVLPPEKPPRPSTSSPSSTQVLSPDKPPRPSTGNPIILKRLARDPAEVDCPACKTRTMTYVHRHAGRKAHMWAAGTTAFTGVLGFVPYMIPVLKDIDHFCTNCGEHLARWRRSGNAKIMYPPETT